VVLPASFLGAAFLTAFLLCFLVFGASTLLPLAGGLAGVCAGAWAANIIGTEATAKTTAIIVFFISFSPLRAFRPLTIPCSGRWRNSSIAYRGYSGSRIGRYCG